MIDKYLEIINMPHHESKVHKKMSRKNRAGQFAPFAALTGYDQLVEEKGKLLDEPVNLSDDEIEEINNVLNNINRDDEVFVKYYRNDLIHQIKGIIKNINSSYKYLIIGLMKVEYKEIIEIKKL